MRKTLMFVIAAAAAFVTESPFAQGLGWTRIGRLHDYDWKVGPYANTGEEAKTMTERIVRHPGASYLRLLFADFRLSPGSAIEITALEDGEVEVLTPEVLARHDGHSSFFNGDAVRVRFVVAPGARQDGFKLPRIAAGLPAIRAPMTLCGVDDRVLSYDKRVARIVINSTHCKCSAFLISPYNCFATAGHCFSKFFIINLAVEFNVPLSDENGNCQHPPVTDQYQWMGAQKVIWKNEGVGEDWAIFKTQRNGTTNKHAGQAQGAHFKFGKVPAPKSRVVVTGYGTDSTPNLTRYRVQQTSTGPLVELDGTTLRYEVDSENGNSGCPVIDSSTDRVIAIHAYGGCGWDSGSNKGTWIWHPDFLAACDDLCSPPDFGSFDWIAPPPSEDCRGSILDRCNRQAASLNSGSAASELLAVSGSPGIEYLIATKNARASKICGLEFLSTARSQTRAAVALYLADSTGAPQARPVRTGTMTVSPKAAWARAMWAPLSLAANTRFFVSFTRPRQAAGIGVVEHAAIGTHFERSSAGVRGPITKLAWAFRVLEGDPSKRARAHIASRRVPVVGGSYEITLSGAPARTPALLLQGLSHRQWGALRLPFSLQAFGARGCSLGVSIDWTFGAASDANGLARVPLSIPRIPRLAGGQLYYQWLVVDPRANGLGLTSSNAARTRIGK